MKNVKNATRGELYQELINLGGTEGRVRRVIKELEDRMFTLGREEIIFQIPYLTTGLKTDLAAGIDSWASNLQL